ncbi:MAG: MATE family efflux transporter [Lachnospiraceae bacterium]|nr:MATE family efflux transporter [Lachnospiraceae bacterium]
MEQDNKILTGTIWKAILSFFFPILIGTFFQQLYNTIDAAIVGHFADANALSSVGGSSGVIINFVVGFFTGLSAGCTVLISQYYGARDEKRLEAALHTTYAFGIIGGILFGSLGIIFVPSVLKLMKTPDVLLYQSTLYLRIYFAGLIFVFIYNLGAAVLRALGDSKRPLYYLIACTFVNIILDTLFVVIFRLDVLGVALATLISQAFSAVLVTYCLMAKTKEAKLVLKKIRLDMDTFIRMLRIGLPSGIQSSTYSLSNMFIQSAINTFGVVAVAGWTAESKVDVIFWMINGSFGIAAATFVGQNFGANNMDRVRKGVRTCLAMALTTAIIISGFLLTAGKYMLWLFTTKPEVIEMGAHMISLIVPGYFLFAFIEIFASSLRAQGKTLIPTLINISGVVGFRVIWVMLFTSKGNIDFIIYCYPLSWFICAVMMTVYYFYARRRQLQKELALSGQ